MNWLKLVLGLLLLVVAARQWRSRPKEGDTPAVPKWMDTIDSFTPAKSAGTVFLLAGINPKNLLLVIGDAISGFSAQTAVGGVRWIADEVEDTTTAVPSAPIAEPTASITAPIVTNPFVAACQNCTTAVVRSISNPRRAMSGGGSGNTPAADVTALRIASMSAGDGGAATRISTSERRVR